MARPLKENLDYFSHDAQMRNDPKIRALRAKFGNEGYAVWCFFLEAITDAAGFVLDWSELGKEILAGDFGVESERLVEIVGYLERLGLVQIEADRLQCSKLLDRLRPAIEKREKMQKLYVDRVSAAETPDKRVSAAETPISDAGITQSKVKESKVNLVVEEEGPNGFFFEKNPASLEAKKEKNPPPFSGAPPPWVSDEWVADLRADKIHLDQWSMAKGYKPGELIALLPNFLNSKQAVGDKPPETFTDFRKNFFFWADKQPKNGKPNSNPRNATPPSRTIGDFQPGAIAIGRT